MFLSHLVTEICQKEDFHNSVAAILDFCKLDHVPLIIFSYTFFCYSGYISETNSVGIISVAISGGSFGIMTGLYRVTPLSVYQWAVAYKSAS